MEEDREKINQKLIELNGGTIEGPWTDGQGFHAIQKFTFEPDPVTSSKFYQNEGFPIKFFLNTVTGELKIFSARLFKAD